MLTTNLVIMSAAEAKTLVQGINKLVPEFAGKKHRYDVLQEIGLLTLYDELREAVKNNEKLENLVLVSET